MNNKNKLPSQIKARKKYNADKMSHIGIGVKIQERKIYEQAANYYNLPLSQFMRSCAMYCIQNNIDISTINIKDFQQENDTKKSTPDHD